MVIMECLYLYEFVMVDTGGGAMTRRSYSKSKVVDNGGGGRRTQTTTRKRQGMTNIKRSKHHFTYFNYSNEMRDRGDNQ